MKVLLVNGSPHKNGCTYTALCEAEKTLNANGVETEIFWIGNNAIRGCIGCNACYKTGKCAFSDELLESFLAKAESADGFIIGSPVYYAAPNASLLALLTRAFYSHGKAFKHKCAAAVVSCRRGGASAAFEVLNKYFTISQMPVASSQYWNSVHGNSPEDVMQDLEGLQTMRTLAVNLAAMIKTVPKDIETEKVIRTNFINKRT